MSADWRPDKFWDLHTPQNTYDVALTLKDSSGKSLDNRFARTDLCTDPKAMKPFGRHIG